MNTITQAVILAGGLGSRMRPLTNSIPKPMIPIHEKPFLHYIVDLLKQNSIKEIVILTGYKNEVIENYFNDGKKFGVNITYSFSPIDDETGTRIRNAKELLHDTFLLLYGDNYWPLQLGQLMSFYKKMNTPAMVTVYSNPDNYSKNNILVGENGLVEIYDKSRIVKELNGVDIGFFILEKSLIESLPKENFSFEKIVIPELIEKKQLAGFMTYHKYYGLSNLERIPIIEEFFKPKKIILLDRDGVINKKASQSDYIKNWKEFEILPGVLTALMLLLKKKYQIYIITNQAGIGRGKMTEKNLNDIHKKFLSVCKKNGIVIKQIYHCPHKWEEGCFCRKPQPGMLFKAASDHHFDLTKSIFIGDDERDIKAGTAANCKTIILKQEETLLDIAQGLV